MTCPICAGEYGDNVTCHGSTAAERRRLHLEDRARRRQDRRDAAARRDARHAPDDENVSPTSDTTTSLPDDTLPCG